MRQHADDGQVQHSRNAPVRASRRWCVPDGARCTAGQASLHWALL